MRPALQRFSQVSFLCKKTTQKAPKRLEKSSIKGSKRVRIFGCKIGSRSIFAKTPGIHAFQALTQKTDRSLGSWPKEPQILMISAFQGWPFFPLTLILTLTNILQAELWSGKLKLDTEGVEIGHGSVVCWTQIYRVSDNSYPDSGQEAYQWNTCLKKG